MSIVVSICPMILTPSFSLARAEILLAIATIFREFEMELYETTVDDVRIARDMFNGHPKKGSQGVRVMIKKWNGHPGRGK
jgi:activator of HSP90 ATPase